MLSRHSARLGSAAVAGLALAVGALAGPGSMARAGALPGAVPGGTISTMAGGVGGPGRATSVALGPCGVRSAGGWLYIGNGSTVRKVNAATDWLSTVAGNNAAGPKRDGGAAADTAIGLCAVALDGAGDMVIAAARQIRMIPASTGTFYGQRMTAGHVYTVVDAGDFTVAARRLAMAGLPSTPHWVMPWTWPSTATGTC